MKLNSSIKEKRQHTLEKELRKNVRKTRANNRNFEDEQEHILQSKIAWNDC